MDANSSACEIGISVSLSPCNISTGADTDYAWARRDILQDDGKLIVAGIAVSEGKSVDIALRRHNLDGSLDDTFGTDGLVVQDFDEKSKEGTN